MLLLASLTDQVKTWQDIFGGGPLAAFLGLMIVALVTIFWLYQRSNSALLKEKDDHAETIRTVTALTATVTQTWSEQLRATERAADLQEKTIAQLERSLTLSEWSKNQLPGGNHP